MGQLYLCRQYYPVAIKSIQNFKYFYQIWTFWSSNRKMQQGLTLRTARLPDMPEMIGRAGQIVVDLTVRNREKSASKQVFIGKKSGLKFKLAYSQTASCKMILRVAITWTRKFLRVGSPIRTTCSRSADR